MLASGPLEQEVKIPVERLAPVLARLETAGARLETARRLEDNAVLDTPDLQLLGSGRLLRLRRWGGEVVLTFKGPATYRDGVKTRLELETTVAEPEVMLAIFGQLGCTIQRRYQKYRETWRLGEVTVALDETPIGCFVEIEGPAGALAASAHALGLDLARAIPASYQELWQQWRRDHPGSPRDMLFPGQE
ncbi:MAG TPA: class IV adenylate cyclase [Thermoanaerobaculaceae bacterium]|nr:class IV adenylate cyclase [Thermoanaerobaculaceae bacterium]HRS17307.1 class IV adenylate cyclase [Thermoanaerobaculaceae bacterium]